ncbi:HlyD family secretion protein [Nitratireductor aquibiodomus]|uniref:HlyD family secretion protein n=1 Tax=Nitratireductor aquibiodomus TaxID=204799 RepID=A0A1H4J0S9_9HYPH|nr:HlyD family secretion protein [Nitratireductor aquibiodomus]
MTDHESGGAASAIAQDPSAKARSSGTKRRWSLLLTGAALLAASIWFFAGARSGQPEAAYTSQLVERGNLVARVATTAVLRPRTQIEISSELKGTIQSVPVRQNQRIRRGDILAKLDSTVFEYEVERGEAFVETAQASLSDAGISLKEAERKLARARALRAKNALSEQKLEDVQAEYDRAQNRVATARADLSVKQVELRLKRFNLSRTTIRSPIDGVVLSRSAEPGKTMFASSDDGVLFILAEDLERMELIAKINEADIGAVAQGQEASFTVDAYPDRAFRAAIRDVSFAHKNDDNLVTYEANLDVRNSGLKLRPGMTASVSIKTDEAENALLIPASALRYRPQIMEEEPILKGPGEPRDSALVHVLENGKLKPVRVRLGVRNWEKVEVLSGLSEGQSVITGDLTGAHAQ